MTKTDIIILMVLSIIFTNIIHAIIWINTVVYHNDINLICSHITIFVLGCLLFDLSICVSKISRSIIANIVGFIVAMFGTMFLIVVIVGLFINFGVGG